MTAGEVSRRAERRLRLIVGGLLLLVSCTGMPPAKRVAYDLFVCRVDALDPYLGGMFDTAQIVRGFSQGKVDLLSLLTALGYQGKDLDKAAAAMKACYDRSLPAQPQQQPLVAPPPSPGDRVM